MRFLDGSWQHMAIAMITSLVLLCGPLAIMPALMAELVPTSIRTIGVGFSYAIATAVFGGTVPALQTWISGNWGPADFGLYITLAIVISLVVSVTIPETGGKDLTAEATTDSSPIADPTGPIPPEGGGETEAPGRSTSYSSTRTPSVPDPSTEETR